MKHTLFTLISNAYEVVAIHHYTPLFLFLEEILLMYCDMPKR